MTIIRENYMDIAKKQASESRIWIKTCNPETSEEKLDAYEIGFERGFMKAVIMLEESQ